DTDERDLLPCPPSGSVYSVAALYSTRAANVITNPSGSSIANSRMPYHCVVSGITIRPFDLIRSWSASTSAAAPSISMNIEPPADALTRPAQSGCSLSASAVSLKKISTGPLTTDANTNGGPSGTV